MSSEVSSKVSSKVPPSSPKLTSSSSNFGSSFFVPFENKGGKEGEKEGGKEGEKEGGKGYKALVLFEWNSKVFFSFSDVSTVLGNFSKSEETNLLPFPSSFPSSSLPFPSSFSSISNVEKLDEEHFFVLDSKGFLVLYQILLPQFSLKIVRTQLFQVNNNSLLVGKKVRLEEDLGEIHLFLLNFSSQQNNSQNNSQQNFVFASVWRIKTPNFEFEPIKINERVSSFNTSSPISQFDFVAFRENSSVTLLTSFSDNKKDLFSFWLSFDTQFKFVSSSLPRKYDVGSNTKLSVEEYGGEVFIGEVHENGYCWSNEKNNKQASISLCDNTPFPCDGVLVYNFGALGEWKEALLGGEMISSCNQFLLHGVFNFGYLPSLFLWKGQPPSPQSHQTLAFVSIHSGVSSPLPSSTCGAPLLFDGIVLDSWIFPPFPSSFSD